VPHPSIEAGHSPTACGRSEPLSPSESVASGATDAIWGMPTSGCLRVAFGGPSVMAAPPQPTHEAPRPRAR